MVILEITLAVLTIVLVWWLHRKPPNFPAGPRGIPFLGYGPLIFSNELPHVGMAKLRSKFGSIFALPLRLKGHGIVLNDWKSMKEAIVLQGEIFSGRPQDNFVKTQFFENGIVGIDGKLWKDKRRFSIHQLKDLGFGKNSIEAVIMGEVEKVLEFLETKTNSIIDTKTSDFLFLPLLNVIWGVISGKTYAMNDKKMLKFKSDLDLFFQYLERFQYLHMFPSFRFLPIIRAKYAHMVKVYQDIMDFLQDDLTEHARTHKEGSARDFIDIYLSEIYKHKHSDQPSPAFEEKQLLGTLFDFFGAGVETTKSSLMWSFLYMASWPEIQKKVQQELDMIIGRERFPQYSDRSQMPYTDAVLLEVQRYATIIPLSVPHATMKDTTLMGYTIPKDTFVMQNVWSVHNDKECWGNPEVFRPERFLNAEGKVERPEYLIPFSAGPRSCLGEPLARMELFLFFTTILQRYFLRIASGIPHPGMEPVLSATMQPRPYSLSVRKRF